jgi:CHAT domain-containing protein/Tfp pilus assembly protein PilF
MEVVLCVGYFKIVPNLQQKNKNYMNYLVLLFLFLASPSLLAQKNPPLLDQLVHIHDLIKEKDLKQARFSLKLFQQKYQHLLGKSSVELQTYLTVKSYLSGVAEDYDDALANITKALIIAEQNPDSLRYLSLTHWAARSVYEQTSQYEKAIQQGEKLATIYSLGGLKEQVDLGRNYQKMGIFYIKKGQANQALEYFNKTLSIYNKTPKTTPVDFASLYRAFSMAHAASGDYNQQIKYINKALSITQKDSGKLSKKLEISLLNNLGAYYIRIKQAKKGLETYHKYVAATIKEHGLNSSMTSIAYSNLGICYAQVGDLETAETYFRKNITIKEAIYGAHNPDVALAYGNLVILLDMMSRYQDALKASQQSFVANTKEYESSDYKLDLLPIIQEHELLDPLNAIGNLSNRSRIFYKLYKKEAQLDYLKQAHQTILAQIKILDKIKNELSDEDKIALLNIDFMPFTLGVQFAEELYQITKEKKYLEAAFQLAERSRDAVLTSALSSKKALNFGGVPDSLILKENLLKKDIGKLNKKLSSVKSSDVDYYDLQEQLFALKRAKEQLAKQLEQNYPQYYQIKYKSNVASIEALQTRIITPNTTLIAYYIQYPKAYIWAATAETADLQTIDLDSSYINDIHNFRKVLTDLKYVQKNPRAAIDIYDRLSYKFYTSFVLPALGKQASKHLIIIPDHLLGHLPFEAFTSTYKPQSSINYKNKNYLVKDYDIQYSYSGTLLLQNKTQYDFLPKSVRLLAIAADYNSSNFTQNNRTEEDQLMRHHLIPLPEAVNEVKALEKIALGTFLYGNDASERIFKNKLPNHGIIHLAMHGILNQKNPIASSLAFTENGSQVEDNFLHASEISNLSLEAQLVVLSACETGYGKFERGEGIMSLARSFMHAGVPSLVVSLWQVNDYSTSKIMEYFYKELKNGKSKSEALQAAKILYLENTEGIASHPALWAAFIQLGNSEPLELEQEHFFSLTNIFLFLISIFIILILLRLFLKRRTERIHLGGQNRVL